MLFNSLDFFLFFPVVLLVYYCVPGKCRNYWLLICSYYFYMCWNAKYAILLFLSTFITYLSGIGMDQVGNASIGSSRKLLCKKLITALSFMLNLSILFFFKYYDFATDKLAALFQLFHIQLHIPAFDVLLPVGISFYTFQALSYTMDVYRGEIPAEKNFFQYALFVSFFPQLVAGPIERSKNLLTQLADPQKPSYASLRDGLLLMVWGYFLKLVLADRIALFVDTVYGDYAAYPGAYLVVATVLFAVQIYCDFAGYSVIAMGAARLLGIQLMDNFHAPYLSCSVAEFWRNWHISLTSWFKDYLYIPLGGSRKGTLRTYINKMTVFLASGLWHGASLSFVIWGGLNGLYQILEELLKPLRDRIVSLLGLNRQSIGHKLLCMASTFALVDFSWIFFRANSTSDAIAIVKSICHTKNLWVLFDGSLYTCGLDQKNFTLLIWSIAVLLFADIAKRKGIRVRELIAAQDYWFRCLILILAICGILIFGIWGSGYDAAGFIYFQF